MHRYTYTIHIEPAEEGGFVVTVPALPGCVTEGDTYEQAIANAHEAIEGFVEALTLARQPIPAEPVGSSSADGSAGPRRNRVR
ncbi:MAG: type II toxin-antitoxin system HicB family antitoxin [Tepidisphaerales bacterium]